MKKLLLISLSLIMHIMAVGNDAGQTIKQVNGLMKKKKYEEAKNVLENQKKELDSTNKASADYFYIEWLYAKVLGEMGDTKNMNKAFENTAKKYNKDIHTETKYDYVMIDQAEYLAENGENAAALKKLDELISYKPSKETLEHIYPLYNKLCVSKDGPKPSSNQTYTLQYMQSEIKNGNLVLKNPIKKGWLVNPYIRIGAEGLNDAQPLKGAAADIQVVLPKSELVNLTVDLGGKTYHHRDLSDVALWKFNVKNKFILGKLDMGITTGIGVSDPSNKSATVLGQVDLEKKIKGDFLVANLGYDRHHFTGTLSSIFEETVAQNDVYLKLSHKNKNLYTIGFLTQKSFFEDSNNTFVLGAWGLVSIPTVNRVDFKVGYGFSYSDADKNRYVPENSNAVLLEPIGTELAGIYAPYFTANNQQVHLAIGSLDLLITDKLNLMTTFKCAIHATNNAPLLYVAEDEQGERYVLTAHYRAKYTPWNLAVALNYKATNRVGLNAFYEHDKTFYYKHNRFGVNVTYEF